MSDQTEYRQLLEDVCRVVGVDTTRPKQERRPYDREHFEPKPDHHLRDDLMRRLGVLIHEDKTESIREPDPVFYQGMQS